MQAVTPYSMWADEAVIMPNLVPPVVTYKDVIDYRERIMNCVPEGANFKPLMTLYLTEWTDPNDMAYAFENGAAFAGKLYPAGATTNSESGVKSIDAVMPVLERMAKIGMRLCVHGEVTDPEIDIFDREAVFIDRVLEPLRQRLPELPITLEHVTTKHGVDYVKTHTGVCGSITTQHLACNRNHMLVDGIRPHFYCLPILKTEPDRLALVEASTSAHPRFFLGTDSAPHTKGAKENACGCAGCFTAPNALSIVAEVFDKADSLNQFEAFVSTTGATAYNLPVGDETITLVRREDPVQFPKEIETGVGPVVVFDPGFPLHWEIEEQIAA